MTSMAINLTDDGPRKRLLFDGDEERYELWEIKFLGHLRIRELLDVMDSDEPDAELIHLLDDKSFSLIM